MNRPSRFHVQRGPVAPFAMRAQKMLTAVTPTTSGGNMIWTWTLPPHFPPGKRLRVSFDGGTPSQDGTPLTWDGHGHYEVDKGSLTLSP